MLKFAVAFIYENFPKYDKVEQTASTLRHYKGDKMVAETELSHVVVVRQQMLGLEFVEAENVEDAFKKIRERFPLHILASAISAIPPP